MSSKPFESISTNTVTSPDYLCSILPCSKQIVAYPGRRRYPHVFRDYKNFSWAHCPSSTNSPIYEFPVLSDSPNPWNPTDPQSKLPGEPDRVVFQLNGLIVITYCGMITHSSAVVNGGFIRALRIARKVGGVAPYEREEMLCAGVRLYGNGTVPVCRY